MQMVSSYRSRDGVELLLFMDELGTAFPRKERLWYSQATLGAGEDVVVVARGQLGCDAGGVDGGAVESRSGRHRPY